MGYRVYGMGYRVYGIGYGYGVEFGAEGIECKVWGLLEFISQGLGYRVQVSASRVVS
jgi:hypothetical protein